MLRCTLPFHYLLLLLLLGVLHRTSAAAVTDADHQAIRDTIVEAMNGDFSSAPAKYLALFEDDAVAHNAWCDPYPACYRGLKNISIFLQSVPENTYVALLPEAMVSVGTVGGMMTTVSFSFNGERPSCLYTADTHVSWNITASTSTSATPKINVMRWVYNASEFATALHDCTNNAAYGAGAAVGGRWTDRMQRAEGGGRDADLQAVKDYVVSLQYSYPDQALICDLLVDGARYCDPFPESCAYGRNGCRAMKGLPPNTGARDGRVSAAASGGAAAGKGKGKGKGKGQCRPGSIRPMYPTGPTTGATYIAYSAVSRNSPAGPVKYTLHHTFAMWDLAPVNTSHRSPAPMLASFDWFMPNHNA